MNWLWIVLWSKLILNLDAGTGLEFYEDIRPCPWFQDIGDSYIDVSGLDVFVDDNSKGYFNGTWKFLKDVKSPWKSRYYTEQFKRAEWNIWAIDKANSDFCQSMKNPLDPVYNIFVNQPGCPFLAGVRIILSNLSRNE